MPPTAALWLDDVIRRVRVAYFSMEIAIRAEMHTYAGGLGVLAGDTARSCADLELPVVFVTLVSRSGYLKQRFDEVGHQLDAPDPWNPADWAVPLDSMVAVRIEGRDVWVRAWLYRLQADGPGEIAVLLLDTQLEQNDPQDRSITDRLYGGDATYRLKQEIVLGIAGVRLLRSIGFTVATYHMNEGHAALLAVELLRRLRRPAEVIRPDESPYDPARIRRMCVFTTHTPVEAAVDRFSYDLVERTLGGEIAREELQTVAGADELNMTRLALNLSAFINGVAERHAETTRRLFPGYRIRAITNGVHLATWVHPSLRALLTARTPQWIHEPEFLAWADQLPDADVWAAHQRAKLDLVQLIKARSGIDLQLERPVLAFARRMTAYKRPELLFTDIDRLLAIGRSHGFQIVLAGKAHPQDTEGKRAIEHLHGYMQRLGAAVPAVFLADYDLSIAQTLIAGADIWLNTPLPPLEASGTSGMKAAVNGVLNLSILDGWWAEGCLEGVTGWAIEDAGTPPTADNAARSLYDKLDHVILPLYASDRGRWIWMMKQSIAKIGSYFNTHRMMRRYATEAYLR